MTDDRPAPSRLARFLKGLRKAVWNLFAVLGLAALTLGGCVWMSAQSLYAKDVLQTVHSPDRSARAEIELTRGGFGTVHTIRVHLFLTGEHGGWTIYSSKDDDFRPALRWADRDTLVVGLGCGRFGHLSNPDSRIEGSETRRLKVRFEYPAACPPDQPAR